MAKTTYHDGTQGEALCGRKNIKFLIAMVSWGTSLLLTLMSALGFKHLTKLKIETQKQVEESTSFGCLCFLGFCFGFLLFMSEMKWELFYYYFGFLRFRFGRGILYAVAGVMTALLAKNLGSQCNCEDYFPLMVTGILSMSVFLVQFASIVFFGNNASLSKEKKARNIDIDLEEPKENWRSRKEKKNAAKKTDKTESQSAATCQESDDSTRFSSVVTDSSMEDRRQISQDKENTRKSYDNDMPSWMQG